MGWQLEINIFVSLEAGEINSILCHEAQMDCSVTQKQSFLKPYAKSELFNWNATSYRGKLKTGKGP